MDTTGTFPSPAATSVRRFLLLQTVFCPTKKLLDAQFRSLDSLEAYFCKYPCAADLYLSGYVHEDLLDAFQARLARTTSAQIPAVFLRFRQNLGKARYVNQAVPVALRRHASYRHMLTFDADICFEADVPDLLPRLERLAGLISTSLPQKSGLIACNYRGENVHLFERFDHRLQLGEERVSWPSQAVAPGGGIAGGCIFVDLDAWQQVGGYREVGVYAPEDGYLMIDMEAAGYHMCVAETLHVLHPVTAGQDPEYAAWKAATMQAFSEKLASGEVPDLASAADSAALFWAQRQKS